MKETIIIHLEYKIYWIIFDKDTSINKKIDILYKYFKKYDWKLISDIDWYFKEINKNTLDNMIISSIRTTEMEKVSVFDRTIIQIANIILNKEVKKLI